MQRINLNFESKGDLFFPITHTRSIYELKVGIFSIREKWFNAAAKHGISISFEDPQDSEDSVTLYEILIPSSQADLRLLFNESHGTNYPGFWQLNHPADIIQSLQPSLMDDLVSMMNSFPLSVLPSGVQHHGKHPLMIHSAARIEPCFVNTAEGPVLIDEGANIMQGAMLRGPVYIGRNSTVKMGASLYAGTCIGNDCVVGGEIKNSIFHAFANKSHHGYIGDSYIGAWSNLGAGTSCSNVKNTGSPVKFFMEKTGEMMTAGPKCGVFMGDHVRTAINTAINSGTVIGPFSNIFEQNGLSAKYIPPFSWGGKTGEIYQLEKLIADVQRWQAMKGIPTSTEQIETIYKLYQNQDHEKANRSSQLENEQEPE